MADSRPTASIIVVAHDRRTYVKEAVESVIRQDVDPAEFEVIAVKNFTDPSLERYLEQVGARSDL